MLGIVFALTWFRQYVLGRHIEVFTDHKPQLPSVKKPFDDVPPRLQRWLVSLMSFDYTLKHVPAKQLSCTDTLSRAPLPDSEGTPAESQSLHLYVSLVLEAAPVSTDEIRHVTEEDATLSNIRRRVLTSWQDLCPSEQPSYLVRDKLTVVDGIVLFSARFLIPEGLCSAVMALAHESHPGQDAFHDALRQRVWWPGLTKDANLYVERCSVCWCCKTTSSRE